jgi:CRP-like cAMP-binding protein
MRIVNLTVTFVQISSSLPSVIEIRWPPDLVGFVEVLNFVNIDVLSLIGASCVGNFDFRVGFCIMQLIPIGILALAAVEFNCSQRSHRLKLSKMNAAEKKRHYIQALHELFELVDRDNSGKVDPTELCLMLKQLGWPTNVEASKQIMEDTVGVEMGTDGKPPRLSKDAFVVAITSGRMIETLMREQVSAQEKRATLNTEDKLVAWTVRRHHASLAFSGAVQLLLFAHTPVSRKVFQWFLCNDISGIGFLRVDYRIVCYGNSWYAFTPVILTVLVGYIVALPLSLAVYLFVHRNELYSKAILQRIGFLYSPFNRSAPWWAIHDLVLKMALTGLLIFIPDEERAGVAVMLCMIAIANLNYFRPFKSSLEFWLSQLSLLITSTKYVVATVLSAIDQEASPNAIERIRTAGILLIVLDVIFFCVVGGSILVAGLLLRRKIRGNDEWNNDKMMMPTTTNTVDIDLTRVVPVSEVPQSAQNQQPLADDSMSTDAITSSNETLVKNITQSFEAHERALQRTQTWRQNKSRRRTEMRLAARLKVKKSKCLHKVPIFSGLSDAAIEAILNRTKHSKVKCGTVLCQEGDEADEFYVIINGSIAVTVKQPAPPGSAEGAGSMIELRVGTLRALDFAGENAVVGGKDDKNQPQRVRGATLTAESDCELLRLCTEDWRALLQSGVMGENIVSGLESGLAQREKSNTTAIEMVGVTTTSP